MDDLVSMADDLGHELGTQAGPAVVDLLGSDVGRADLADGERRVAAGARAAAQRARVGAEEADADMLPPGEC
jgi:hypothetical protein